jgi:hypothetical protein
MWSSGTYTCLFCGREDDYSGSDVGDQVRTGCKCGARFTVSRSEGRIVYVDELPPEEVEVRLTAELDLSAREYESEADLIEAAKEIVDEDDSELSAFVSPSKAPKVYPEDPEEVTDEVLDAVFDRKEKAVDNALDDHGAFNMLVGEVMVEMDRETSPTVAADAIQERLDASKTSAGMV